MTLAAGFRVGSYEIQSLLGSGGMGEVYRARDTKLNRDVALKILRQEFTLDADRLARFKREAQLLASLNHPNIAAIYGFEESDGVQALVLELVEGPTLGDVIERAQGSGLRAQGPHGMPIDDALAIARQIADALEAAHEHGIIHRDLKPANVKVRDDGTVKVLDFGLAKALDPLTPALSPRGEGWGEGDAVSQSPTISVAATGAGVILGTAAYMSPEQARDKPVDKRTDIWAFGCVLYEMLTGKRAFGGDEVTDVLAFVITKEPEWSALPSTLPPAIRRLLRRSLEKDRKRRLADIGVARLEIDEAQGGPQVDEPAAPRALWRRERLAWGSALALLTVAAVMAVWVLRPVLPAPEMRLEITTPTTADPVSLAISPNGQKIIFAATSEGRSQLWLRSLDSVSAQPLAGTEGGTYPFWSSDSRSMGFFADGKLKRIDIDGGSSQVLANAVLGWGGTWNRDGTILFAPNSASPIFRIAPAGGEPVVLTRLDLPQQTSHRFPQFLPDGRHFLYYVTGAPDVRGVYIAQLEGSETRRVLDADAAAVYASSGQLLFVRQSTLFAQPFDPVRLELTENPFPMAEQVEMETDTTTSTASWLDI